jgi:chromosome segregation ATPase
MSSRFAAPCLLFAFVFGSLAPAVGAQDSDALRESVKRLESRLDQFAKRLESLGTTRAARPANASGTTATTSARPATTDGDAEARRLAAELARATKENADWKARVEAMRREADQLRSATVAATRKAQADESRQLGELRKAQQETGVLRRQLQLAEAAAAQAKQAAAENQKLKSELTRLRQTSEITATQKSALERQLAETTRRSERPTSPAMTAPTRAAAPAPASAPAPAATPGPIQIHNEGGTVIIHVHGGDAPNVPAPAPRAPAADAQPPRRLHI